METKPRSKESKHPQSRLTTCNSQDDQCHLQSPKLMQNITLVPCISGIPTERDIHWCCPQWKLCNMAKTNGDAHQPILTRLRQDSKRTPKGSTPRHPINKTKIIRENYRKQDSQDQNWGQKITFSSNPNHQNPQNFLPHWRPLQLNSHWPNGGLPIHFPTRQQIYHGSNPPQCKLHLCQTYV